MHSLIKETIVSWHNSFVGKKGKRCGMQPHYAYFGPYGKREIEKPLKIPNWWTKLLCSPFCTFFGMGQGACRL